MTYLFYFLSGHIIGHFTAIALIFLENNSSLLGIIQFTANFSLTLIFLSKFIYVNRFHFNKLQFHQQICWQQCLDKLNQKFDN